MKPKQLPGGTQAHYNAERESWSSLCEDLGLSDLPRADVVSEPDGPTNAEILNMSDDELLALAHQQFGADVRSEYEALLCVDDGLEAAAPANVNSGIFAVGVACLVAVFALGFVFGQVVDFRGNAPVATASQSVEPMVDSYDTAANPLYEPQTFAVEPGPRPVLMTTTRIEISPVGNGDAMEIMRTTQTVEVPGIGHIVSGERPRPRPVVPDVMGRGEPEPVDRDVAEPLFMLGQSIPNLEAMLIQAEARLTTILDAQY